MQGFETDPSMTEEKAAAWPIDAAQLARQTGGDEALAREVLAMFAGQLRELIGALPRLETGSVANAMHRLKGSARAVGAFQLAACAADLEEAPTDAATRARFADAAEEVLRAIEAVEPQGGS